MTTLTPLAPLLGHVLVLTHGPAFGRAHVDCTCDQPPQTVHASTRSAERAGLRHYIDHAPDGADKHRAQQLLGQITPKRKRAQR